MNVKATGNIGLLMRCYEALHNWPALAMLAGGVVIGGGLLVTAGTISMRLGFFAGLLALVAVLVYLAGINGAGLLLVDQADGQPSRGIGAAFFGGLRATLNIFLAVLLLLLGLLLVCVALYLLALLGRIPGIGPLFAFLLAGPGAIVLLFCYGVLTIGMPLLLVAVWRGENILGALGKAVDIVLKRPLDALLHFVLLWLIVAPVAVFVFVLLAVASALSISMYGHGFGGGMGGGMEGMLLSGLQGMGAASASVAIVFAVVVALFALVNMFGYIMVYDSLSAGLGAMTEDHLRGGIQQIKQKVEQHRQQAAAAAAASAAAAHAAAEAAAAQAAAPEAAACKACGARLNPGDKFCGECGQRT